MPGPVADSFFPLKRQRSQLVIVGMVPCHHASIHLFFFSSSSSSDPVGWDEGVGVAAVVSRLQLPVSRSGPIHWGSMRWKGGTSASPRQTMVYRRPVGMLIL